MDFLERSKTKKFLLAVNPTMHSFWEKKKSIMGKKVLFFLASFKKQGTSIFFGVVFNNPH